MNVSTTAVMFSGGPTNWCATSGPAADYRTVWLNPQLVDRKGRDRVETYRATMKGIDARFWSYMNARMQGNAARREALGIAPGESIAAALARFLDESIAETLEAE